MFEIEETWRNNYILNFVNPGFGNHSRQQTLVRSEAQLILPVDQSNFERVAKIYKSSGYSPKIETLAEYAGLEYNLDDKALFDVKGRDNARRAYNQMASRVETAARVAILKALEI